MAAKVWKGFEVCETEGCCGVNQIAWFTSSDALSDNAVSGKTEQAAWEKLFKELLKLPRGYVYQMWFVKNRNYQGEPNENFEAEPLRELVCTIEGCVCLGTTVNPNSGNIIEGYQWIGK